MNGIELTRRTGSELVRFVRTLGKHRYVASRLHLVHAFAIEGAALGGSPDLGEAAAWAETVLGDPSVELDSRDERLVRSATDAELVAVLDAFWSPPGPSHAQLERRLTAIGVDPRDGGRTPFDESEEDAIFPVLVDAGWELLALKDLDPERHKGAMQAFDDQLAWEVALFEEENALPPVTPLHELPTLGAVELLAAFDGEGRSIAPFVLWEDGNPTYLDYVLRGVMRAAKLEPDD